ncbi:MAG: 2-oxoacid:acceptor oxidoreductase family protein [Desulfobacteraceae bacterium]|nr:2-oxoacid:acceptor oxidoreductase family protein [Desulfobacteraceae bacterium]
MDKTTQQIIISGLGGQGVLFVTRLLAEAAIGKGLSVLISETHGMAQRGGNVISHLKVGPEAGRGALISPLIRPGRADVLLALHPEAMLVHGHFLRPEGTPFGEGGGASPGPYTVDACSIAASLGSPVSANLVLLGFAAASGKLFCGPEQIEGVLKGFSGKRAEISLKAFRAGCEAAGATSAN